MFFIFYSFHLKGKYINKITVNYWNKNTAPAGGIFPKHLIF